MGWCDTSYYICDTSFKICLKRDYYSDIIAQFTIAGSSNGRTTASGAVNWGSSPCPATIECLHVVIVRMMKGKVIKPNGQENLIPPFTRGQVAEAFIQARHNVGIKMSESAQRLFEISNQMDGKMQSRYDTQREEYALQGTLSKGVADRAFELVESARASQCLEQVSQSKNLTISDGVVFMAYDFGINEAVWFYFSEVGGGLRVNVIGIEVKGVSSASLLGVHALNKSVGESITFQVPDFEDVEHFEILAII